MRPSVWYSAVPCTQCFSWWRPRAPHEPSRVLWVFSREALLIQGWAQEQLPEARLQLRKRLGKRQQRKLLHLGPTATPPASYAKRGVLQELILCCTDGTNCCTPTNCSGAQPRRVGVAAQSLGAVPSVQTAKPVNPLGWKVYSLLEVPARADGWEKQASLFNKNPQSSGFV